MGTRFKSLMGVLVLVTASTIFASAASAQQAPFSRYKSVADAFEDAFFSNDRDFVQNRTYGRQIDTYFGTRGFTDREIERDADAIDSLYKRLMRRQATDGPTIRTADLPSPYNTSVLTLPAATASEIIPRTADFSPTYPPIVTPPAENQPVRSLW